MHECLMSLERVTSRFGSHNNVVYWCSADGIGRALCWFTTSDCVGRQDRCVHCCHHIHCNLCWCRLVLVSISVRHAPSATLCLWQTSRSMSVFLRQTTPSFRMKSHSLEAKYFQMNSRVQWSEWHEWWYDHKGKRIDPCNRGVSLSDSRSSHLRLSADPRPHGGCEVVRGGLCPIVVGNGATRGVIRREAMRLKRHGQ